MTLTTDILESSFFAERYDGDRSPYSVLSAIVAEVGELAEEIAIHQKDSYKRPGADGVVGEALDVIIACLDMIYIMRRRNVPPAPLGEQLSAFQIDEMMLQELAHKKCRKWLKKIMEHKEEVDKLNK